MGETERGKITDYLIISKVQSRSKSKARRGAVKLAAHSHYLIKDTSKAVHSPASITVLVLQMLILLLTLLATGANVTSAADATSAASATS